MDDLIAFVTARLDEEEPYAAEAAEDAGDDPVRAVREIAVKRAILNAHRTRVHYRMPSAPEFGRDYFCETCSHEYAFSGWCETLTALAFVWSDHPDWNPKWKPEWSA